MHTNVNAFHIRIAPAPLKRQISPLVGRLILPVSDARNQKIHTLGLPAHGKPHSNPLGQLASARGASLPWLRVQRWGHCPASIGAYTEGCVAYASPERPARSEISSGASLVSATTHCSVHSFILHAAGLLASQRSISSARHRKVRSPIRTGDGNIAIRDNWRTCPCDMLTSSATSCSFNNLGRALTVWDIGSL